MVKALDVANFFIDIANKNPDADKQEMTNLRVNKLVYFAQVWSLVLNDKPLFDETIEAWQHGPVVPSVYQAFKKYQKEGITEPCGQYSHLQFTSDEIDLLTDIILNYDQYSSWKLADLTHVIGGPWDAVYSEDKSHIPITQESMKNYYANASFKRFEFKYTEDDIIRTRDADGYLVLPKEYFDDDE